MTERQKKVTDRSKLDEWVLEALQHLGGGASVNEVAREIWERHEHELRASGELFYSWQYDMRWAAQRLQDRGKLTKEKSTRKWVLNS